MDSEEEIPVFTVPFNPDGDSSYFNKDDPNKLLQLLIFLIILLFFLVGIGLLVYFF